MIKKFLLLLFSLAQLSLQAQIVLPRILGHNMVLQQGKPIHIWGKAAVGEAITVTFGKQQKRTKADAQGNWEVYLGALKASDQPQSMWIKGKNSIELKNLLIGEVWLCSGQSNMEYTM